MQQFWAAATRTDSTFGAEQCILVFLLMRRELGGYKEMPIMEDYELVQRLRKHSTPAIIPHAVTTSGRRWQRLGFFRTLITNQASNFQLWFCLAKETQGSMQLGGMTCTVPLSYSKLSL